MKRQYKVTVVEGMEYITTSFWDAFKMWGLGVLVVLALLPTRGSFWIIAAIIVAAFIVKGC